MSFVTFVAQIPFRPKLLECLSAYDRTQFGKDVAAGVTVGVLALPLAMAFAIASGMPPSTGIWTGIIAGFLISFLGGSRVQIGGPTGAFIPIVYGVVAMYGASNLLIATMLAGAFLLAMGIFRMGQLIRFIPISVVIGFTNGIAVVIFMSQIKDFLGLDIDRLPSGFFAQIDTLARSLHLVDPPTLAVSCAAFLFLVFYNRMAQTRALGFLRRAPGPLAVLLAGACLTALFDVPIKTIGDIPREIPPLTMPALSLDALSQLISPAIAIALLGAIESLLSARVADASIEDTHDPNQELIAQGLANLIVPLFGGFAATGAIARTATNIRSGGRTPVAGITHALVLLVIVLVFAPLARHIPLAILSAIVVVVSLNMFDVNAFKRLRHFSNNYRIILLSTFVMTVVFGLTVAIELGMVLSCLLFIYHISELTRIESVPLANTSATRYTASGKPRISAWRIYGSLFFGAANKLEPLLDTPFGEPEILILDAQTLIQLDSTGLDALENLHGKLERGNATLLLSGLHGQPAAMLERTGFIERLGAENLFPNIIAALRAAEKRLADDKGDN
ncbi:MAG: SulP family inorganic anion transporter [Zoogloeaceae bacterium]|jgi:SulP family sulfate permease|nr:SulP family inorganic anion transporter [Zoogloeaceae bacterium]